MSFLSHSETFPAPFGSRVARRQAPRAELLSIQGLAGKSFTYPVRILPTHVSLLPPGLIHPEQRGLPALCHFVLSGACDYIYPEFLFYFGRSSFNIQLFSLQAKLSPLFPSLLSVDNFIREFSVVSVPVLPVVWADCIEPVLTPMSPRWAVQTVAVFA